MKILYNLKDAYSRDALEKLFTGKASTYLNAFKTEVFDFEAMIKKLTDKENNFQKQIADGIRGAAKKASVALTNGAINALSDHFDLKLEAEKKQATGHIIDTQAIAGAGSRDVGVAGSVAVTVLNADTKASVAAGGTITVTGDMTVQADETSYVHSVASAAAD